jgi:parallel beta-helix repeat protein
MTRWALAVVLVFGLSIAAIAAPRGPIAIFGDSEFTEENGVVGGTGSAEDPYVIAGWDIDVTDDDVFGIQIENATAAFVLRGNVVRGGSDPEGAAIRVGFSSGGEIDGCMISDSLVGIEIVYSMDLTVKDCLINSLGVGLRVEGESSEEYRHDIGRTNLLNGQPIVYVYGADGETIEGEFASHITIAGSRNLTVQNNEVVNGDGILLAFVTDSTVTGNAIYRTTPVWSEHGMHLYRSDRNLVTGNSMWNNRLAGLQLGLSNDNQIIGNQLLANHTGARLFASDGNALEENVAFSNTVGFLLTGGSNGNELIGNVIQHENTKEGISIEYGSRNLVERNGLTDCEIGLGVAAPSSENTVFANTIVGGAYGIFVSGSLNTFEQNLVSQQSRGILFPETYGDTITRGNSFVRNVLADNANHVYTNLDSAENEFTENAFLGPAQRVVQDHGSNNRWTVDGIGNYWGWTSVTDEDGDGVGDDPIVVYVTEAKDVAPIVAVDPLEAGLGILSTLPARVVGLERSDGTSVSQQVVVAADGPGRWVGFRGFPEQFLPDYPGILFDYGREQDGRFTMSMVLFDLDIVFFDSAGLVVGRTTMTANDEELYTAESPFQYALELPAGTLEELGIGPESRLILP